MVMTQKELNPAVREANKKRMCRSKHMELQKTSKFQDIRASHVKGKHDCTKCGERERDGKKLQRYLTCKNTDKITWRFKTLSELPPDEFLF